MSFRYDTSVEDLIFAQKGDQEKALKLLSVLADLRQKEKIEDVSLEEDNPDHALAVLMSRRQDKDLAKINWSMRDRVAHKDIAWFTNTVLLGDRAAGAERVLEKKHEVHEQFLTKALSNKTLTPFSLFPTMLKNDDASLLALSIATLSPLAPLVWAEAQKTPHKIDDREVLSMFRVRDKLSQLNVYPETPKIVKPILEETAVRLSRKQPLSRGDAELCVAALSWVVNKVDRKSVKEFDRVVVISPLVVETLEAVARHGHIDTLFSHTKNFGGVMLLAAAFDVMPESTRSAVIDQWLLHEENKKESANVMNFPLSSTSAAMTGDQTYRFMNIFSGTVIHMVKEKSRGSLGSSLMYVKSLLENLDKVNVFSEEDGMKEEVKEWLADLSESLKSVSYELSYGYNKSTEKAQVTLERCVLDLQTRWLAQKSSRPERKM